jgi:hypothetical protein
MPKIKKSQAKTQAELAHKRNEMNILRQWMFKTASYTLLLSFACFIASIIFNANIVVLPNMDTSKLMKVLDYLLRGIPIILLYFFMFVSMGNLYELRGEIMKFKHILLLAVLCFMQGCTNGWVALVAGIGIVGVSIYFYIMQNKIP